MGQPSIAMLQNATVARLDEISLSRNPYQGHFGSLRRTVARNLKSWLGVAID
jgi:hypothetical protein